MFTGIIEEIGIIKRVKRSGGGMVLEISAPKSSKELRINDSVSLNGVCQTIVLKAGSTFTVEAVEETLKKTNFNTLDEGKSVNIELPLRLNDRLDGHLVLGHVDAVGKIKKIQKKKNSWIISVTFPGDFSKYVIPEGSVAVDGVSLTIAAYGTNEFTLSIIPHTMKHTILPGYKPGTEVNLEFDVIGKYIERFTSFKEPQKKSSLFLKESELRKLGY